MIPVSSSAVLRSCSGLRFSVGRGSPRAYGFAPSRSCRLHNRSFRCQPCLTIHGEVEAGGVKRKPRANCSTVSGLGKLNQRRGASQSVRSKIDRRSRDAKQVVSELDNEAKTVTAYCAAEQYRIAEAAAILQDAGYVLDPSNTGLYPQVLHVRASKLAFDGSNSSPGDIFVFPSGAVVAWDVEETAIMNLILVALLPAAEHSHTAHLETEDLRYIEDSHSHKSRMRGDQIEIGIKLNPSLLVDASTTMTDEQHTQQHETDLTLAKIAFSSGLARSVKLAVLENALEAYFQSTRTIPDLMARGSKITFTRRFVIRKTGELLKLRAQLNLSSELTDSLPDMFWDTKYELGLERYFEQVGRALDVYVRSKVLNQKMDYAQEIVTVLREQLSERHGLTLEWLIIGLIAFEVLFEIHRVVREHRDGLAEFFGGTRAPKDLEDG